MSVRDAARVLLHQHGYLFVVTRTHHPVVRDPQTGERHGFAVQQELWVAPVGSLLLDITPELSAMGERFGYRCLACPLAAAIPVADYTPLGPDAEKLALFRRFLETHAHPISVR